MDKKMDTILLPVITEESLIIGNNKAFGICFDKDMLPNLKEILGLIPRGSKKTKGGQIHEFGSFGPYRWSSRCRSCGCPEYPERGNSDISSGSKGHGRQPNRFNRLFWKGNCRECFKQGRKEGRQDISEGTGEKRKLWPEKSKLGFRTVLEEDCCWREVCRINRVVAGGHGAT